MRCMAARRRRFRHTAHASPRRWPTAAKSRSPEVVVGLADDTRNAAASIGQRGSAVRRRFAPHDVVGRVDDAVLIVVA